MYKTLYWSKLSKVSWVNALIPWIGILLSCFCMMDEPCNHTEHSLNQTISDTDYSTSNEMMAHALRPRIVFNLC